MDSDPNLLRSRSLVFLVGVFRSGTSLLHRLVNAHPEIQLMWEADALRFLPAETPPAWQTRLDLWNGCLSRHRLDPSALPERASREEAALALYQAHAADPAIRVMGEKSPYYADILPRLARSFPHARFIVVHRHPAAVVASVKQASRGNRFFRQPGMPLRVVKDAGRLLRDAQRLKRRGHAVLEIEFDELVRHPEPVIESAWKWLGVSEVRLSDCLPDSDPMLLPPGEHHDHAKGSPVIAERAAVPRGSRMIDRHVAFRAETGLRPAEYLLMARDEWIYRTLLATDVARRELFRRLPCPLLERHRRKSGHPVARGVGEPR